jgi:hypothetical protein
MTELDVNEPFLAAPDVQTVMPGFQIVQQVRGFVDDNVTVRIGSLVGGPPHMRMVSCQAVASYFNVGRFEPMIPE